ncbi:MAG: hypothetical protein JWQ38_1060 [Flavipsychrobacter sp.]|nr:hypothetical protein [Flavipsychrobacter sp.]
MKKIFLSLLAIVTIVTANAQSWTTVPSSTNCNLFGVSFGDNSTIYTTGSFGLDSCTILKSVDAGVSFSRLSAAFMPLNAVPKAVAFTNTDTGCIAGGVYAGGVYTGGFIYHTTDGGLSWTPVVTGASTIFNNICFPTAKIGYACGSYFSNAIVYKTTDGGATWTSIYTSSSPLSTGKMSMIDANTGYIAGMDNVTHQALLIKISGGAVSGTITSSTYPSFNGIHFSSLTNGFVTADTGTIMPTVKSFVLKTTDGGVTWTTVHVGGYDPESCIRFDGSDAFVIGGYGLTSLDAGTTWSVMSPLPGPGSPFDIAIRNNVRIIVGEGGMILRQESTTGIAEKETAANEYQLYPNPMLSETRISFNKPQCNSLVQITDVAGREIKKVIVNGSIATISNDGMSPGFYFVTVNTTKGAITSRLVVQ